MSNRNYVRTALFLDFDNIFIRLEEENREAALAFATDPGRWLSWIADELPRDHLGEGLGRRRILVRRCYLNPRVFHRFRADFIRAAFEVVDCPPLTGGGKTSADIHMVMDVLDALSHPTPFDEFIILSGDADFTPVLLRLSTHDRRTAVLTVGQASPAYKAACDLLIGQDAFIEQGLGVEPREETDGVAPAVTRNAWLEAVLERIGAQLAEITSMTGGVEASQLPAVYKDLEEFRASHDWLGFGSLRSLTDAIVSRRSDLTLSDEDPWYVRPTPAAAATPASSEERSELAERIVAGVREMVAASDAPVHLARAAGEVPDDLRDALAGTRWLGYGSFKGLLEAAQADDLAVSPVMPGYVYDPQRHQEPVDERRPDAFAAEHPEMAALARRLSHITDTPYLAPAQYAVLFREIAREIGEHGYQITRTSKAVRDRCNGKGVPIARSHVNFVLRGINFAGHRLGDAGDEDPGHLAVTFTDNVLNLCQQAQLELTGDEMRLLRRWIGGERAGESAEETDRTDADAVGDADAASGEPSEGEAEPGGERPRDPVGLPVTVVADD